MPLPWKEKLSDGSGSGSGSGSRISQLVTNLPLPKRGGALVVETGFPTSIVDIFLKNRDRMKKTAKNGPKRVKQQQQRQQVGGTEIEAPWAAPEEANRASPQQSRYSIEEEGEERASGRVGGFPSRVLEVAVVVILCLLALFTKWLVIGATIAAFSLSCVEFVGSIPVIGFSGSSEPDSAYKFDSLKCDSSKSEAESEGIEVWQLNPVIEDSSTSNVEDDAVVGEYYENQEPPRRRRKLKSKIIKLVVPKKIRNQMKG